MDFSQTKTLNPNAPYGHSPNSITGGQGSRWRALLGPSMALLICPVIMLIFGLIILGHMAPIHAGLQKLDYDPPYSYLFNGAALMKGYAPFHTDHPGTPVQLAMGLITVFSWSVATLCGLTSMAYPQSIAAYPEEYLRVIMNAFLIMNCLAVYSVGIAVARSTRLMMAGFACQSAYLLLGELFPRVIHAAPEAFLFLAATGLMAALTPVIIGNENCSDRRAIAVGLFIGLGSASKFNFVPFFLLAFLLRRPLPILKALLAGLFFMFIFLLPIIGKLNSVVAWLISLATHEGHYGEGPTGLIDWTMIPERARIIAAAEPLLVVAAASLTAAILFSRSRDKWTAAVTALAVGALVFLVLKQFQIHYLMPAVAIAPVVIVWAVSRFARRQFPYVVIATIALVLGVASMQNMSSAFANERALRSKNEKAVNEVIARFQNPVVIGAYRSGYKPWAVQFGIAWSDPQFAKLIPDATAGDRLWYNSNKKNIWRSQSEPVDWSYLDQFEKAGRAVLIVQPRGTKIDQKTAQTETLLDQGFGDTVERIIIAPRGNEN